MNPKPFLPAADGGHIMTLYAEMFLRLTPIPGAMHLYGLYPFIRPCGIIITMLRSYKKGYRGEIELVHTLSRLGFMVIRAPRSGRISLASPDIIAAKDGKIIVIECKSRASAFTVPKEQLEELKEWEEKAGATPYIGWKMSRKGWTFMRLSDVERNAGNIGKKFAAENGMPLERAVQAAAR